ncbi:MAG: transcriptional repressor, partial [Caulobacteraceae bacterium]|nr:transcriptional repressor [Caulobacter sp.]
MSAAACDHDHTAPAPSEAAVAAALSRAETRSLEAGARWTQPRRRVYELLVRGGGPVKAYDLMQAFDAGRAAKPPTVYRALEFLEEQGLAHRIPSLNAYVACDEDDAAHTAAFLICDCCGSADEFDPGRLGAVAATASARGFSPR